MGTRQGSLRWIWRPQALLCFVVLCLCIAGLGGVSRNWGVERLVFRPSGQAPAEGAATPRLPRPDCNAKPCIALTFDDGPDERMTPQILDILAQKQVRATFFVVGSRVAGREPVLQREYREGHEIGNHSWNHPDLTKLPPADAETQISRTQQAIASAGVPAPRLLRPPYGAIDDMVANHTHLSVIRWNIDPEDWKTHDPVKVHQNIVAHAKPGGIILLHDIEPPTAAALGPAIDSLAPSYQFVTISQLLDLTPGDQGQFFAGPR
jgi:peptidoglycan/xylan/chitin deacetylase (PgdA/CDA1 family)